MSKMVLMIAAHILICMAIGVSLGCAVFNDCTVSWSCTPQGAEE